MQGLLDSLANVVTQILNHPMIDSPVPDHTLFTDADAFRLYFQYHQSVTELARITMRLKRASRLLRFLPGPPGHPGSYRVHRHRPNRHRQPEPHGPASRDRSRSRDSPAF